MKKIIVASFLALAALVGASARAEGGPLLSFHKDALVLNDLKLAAVKYEAPSLPEAPKLRDWLDGAVKQLGFQVDGGGADPVVAITTECIMRNCESRVTVMREAYLKKVVGKKDVYVRLPKVVVAEFVSSKSFEDNDGRAMAAFESLRDVVVVFTKAAADANAE